MPTGSIVPAVALGLLLAAAANARADEPSSAGAAPPAGLAVDAGAGDWAAVPVTRIASLDLPQLAAAAALALARPAGTADGSAAADDTIPRAKRVPDTLRIKRVSAGPDGKSFLDVIELPIVSQAAGESIQTRLFATDVEMGYGSPGSFIDWHRVTTPRLWILLQGAWDFGTGDGKVHRLVAGDIVLAADTTGQGHTSRNVGKEPSFVLTVRLPAVDSLQPKTTAPPVPKPE